MGQKRVRYDLGKLPEAFQWGSIVLVNDDGSTTRDPGLTQDLIAGCLLRILARLDALGSRPTPAYSLLPDVVRELQAIRGTLENAARVPPAADPAAERAKRVAESRARAMALYLAAGGNADESDDPEPSDPGTKVEALNLSIRARKCMTRLNISTLGELVQRTADELLEARNFGWTSLVEVRAALARHGLKLKGD